MEQFYATHSLFTNPGEYEDLIEDLSHDLNDISRITQGLVYHYVGDQYVYGYQPPTERLVEIDTRYLERILARLMEMDHRPVTEPRTFEHRMVGCCRDFSLLACAILRQQSRPARMRYGFAGYFVPGYWIDHVVVEVWTGDRWRRFDPEVPSTSRNEFDLLDLTDASFITGGRAWQMCRSEGADPSHFGLGPDVPDVRGWWFIRGRLQLDLAALNKQELLCWDEWAFASGDSEITPIDEALLDEAATLSLMPESSAIRAFYTNAAPLRVPETVICYSPHSGPHPVKVG